MSNFRAHKVVAALPVPLEPNCIYMVRTGLGYLQYVSDDAGAVAHPVNNRQVQNITARVHMRNNRWYGPNNSYGPLYVNYSQALGNAVDPLIQWTTRGLPMLQGDHIRSWHVSGRVNNNSITGVQCRMYWKTGPWGGTWDSDGETTLQLLSTINIPFGVNDLRKGSDDFSFVAPDDGQLVMAFRPDAASGNRYFYFDSRISYEQLAVI